MGQRYVITITELRKTDQVKVVGIDQKLSKIIFDAVIINELRIDIGRVFTSRYGQDVTFLNIDGEDSR